MQNILLKCPLCNVKALKVLNLNKLYRKKSTIIIILFIINYNFNVTNTRI